MATRSGALPIQASRLAVNPMSLVPQPASEDQTQGGVPYSVSLQSMKPSDFITTQAPYRCANSACTESISEVWRRECGMCGQTFCYSCTTDVRKLSATGQPDPLGKEKRVCAKCSHLSWEDGNILDHKERFQKHRSERPKVAPPPPLEVVTSIVVEEKRSLAVLAAERLTRGYQANCSAVKGLMADFVVPSWQKPEGWQSDRDAKVCEACKGPLRAKKFRQKSKVHCRLCGRIFCTDCTKNEILLYITEEGRAKWAVNGREGGPTSKPSHFELLSICDPCCKELESAILEEMLEVIEDSVVTKALDFTDTLKLNQKQLMTLLHRIEQLLEEYRKVSDCFRKGENESITVENPVHLLAKLQCRLNGAMAQLSIETKKLQLLKPSTKGQERLLKNITLFFNTFYVDNLYLYRQYQGLLSNLISSDALQAMQAMVCKVSMGDVHKELNVMMFNGLELRKKYFFSDTVLMPLVAVLQVCEDELKALDQTFFDSHCQAVKKALPEDAKSSLMFNIFIQRKVRNHVMAAAMVCHIAASGLKDVLKVLIEKTIENECLRTKEALKNAADEMESSENVFRLIITSTQASKPSGSGAVSSKSDSELTNTTPAQSITDNNMIASNTSLSKPDMKSAPRSNAITCAQTKSNSKSDVNVMKPANASASSKSP